MERMAWGISLIAIVLLLAGCRLDTETAAACRYEVTQALNNGQWDRVLEDIEQRDCAHAFSAEERALNRGAAYIGRAGYDFPDLVPRLLRNADIPKNGADPERLLYLFADFQPPWNGLTDLVRAQREYADLFARSGRDLPTECTRGSFAEMSRAEHEVCFHYGMVGLIKALSGFSLLIPDHLGSWLDGEADCSVDSTRSGVPNQAEASACALLIGLDTRNSGVCPLRDNVRWERPTGAVPRVFQLDHKVVAEVVPVTLEFEANGTCPAGDRTTRYLDPTTSRLALTAGQCHSTDAATQCADDGFDCVPCPVLHPDGGALDVYEGILKGLHQDAEILFYVLAASEAERLRAEVHALRTAICAAVADEADACALDEHGVPNVDTQALASYLLKQARSR